VEAENNRHGGIELLEGANSGATGRGSVSVSRNEGGGAVDVGVERPPPVYTVGRDDRVAASDQDR